jgi:hypothetical protein
VHGMILAAGTLGSFLFGLALCLVYLFWLTLLLAGLYFLFWAPILIVIKLVKYGWRIFVRR